jgi:thiol peroxidase
MSIVTFKGLSVNLKGDIPSVGDIAPNFRFVKTDLTETSLYELGNKAKVIIAVPSLDTGVCATETRKFNEKLAEKHNLIGLVISKDLPFAIKRFCEIDGIKNVVVGSDFRYNEFCNNYNTEMMEGPLKGLSARIVFVLDKDNVIRHVDLVSEVATEPDYDTILEAVAKL